MTGEEVKIAQREFLPVIYKGNFYDRIVARVVKTVKGHDKGSFKEIFCVRLLNERANSVTEALANDVDFTPEYYARKERENTTNVTNEVWCGERKAASDDSTT